MASILSHAFVSFAAGKSVAFLSNRRKVWLTGMFCAIVPDFDAIGYWLGVPYWSMFGHRGFTHSFFFAALLATLVMAVAFRKEANTKRTYWIFWSYFFVATALHPIADAMTNGGLGVAFFAPFSGRRYFFPFRPIEVCSIGFSDLVNGSGAAIFINEFKWLWLPSLAVMGVAYLFRRRA
jgi:inner membrane protein